MMELFADIRSQGRTLIVVSHDPGMAEMADTVLQMESGRLVS